MCDVDEYKNKVRNVNFDLTPDFFEEFLSCSVRKERKIRELEIYLSPEKQIERYQQRELFKNILILDSQLDSISEILQMGTFPDIQRVALEITYVNLEKELKFLLNQPRTTNFDIPDKILILYNKYDSNR